MFDPAAIAVNCLCRIEDEFAGIEKEVRGRLFVIIESEVRRAYASELATSAAPLDPPQSYPR